MTGKLILFEINKKWRSTKFLLLGYLGIQALILLVTRVFLWNTGIANNLTNNGVSSSSNEFSLPFGLTMILFFLLSLALGAFPFLEGIYRFERDMSGKQAYLELMIPAVSWKKLIAKLIATLCSLVVCGTVCLGSIFLFFAVNGNPDSVREAMGQILRGLADNWTQVVLVVVYLLFGFASSFMIIFFCIAIAKSFTHKNTVAVPIGILAFLVITGLLAALAFQLDKIPLLRFEVFSMETNLSRTLADIIAFLAAVAGTSWLMEKRIEH